MRVKILRTRDWAEPTEVKCAICLKRFYLGEASPVLVSEDDIEVGEVCFACVHKGAEHTEHTLNRRAAWSRGVAEEDEELAAEGVTDIPSMGELLAAESFYTEAP